jgi:hypothetical protein
MWACQYCVNTSPPHKQAFQVGGINKRDLRDGYQGCQILISTTYQNGEKINQVTINIPNVQKIYQNVQKIYPNIPTSSIGSPSKIYPNYDFWFEKMPSGNPDGYQEPILR